MEDRYAAELVDGEHRSIPWPLDLPLPMPGDEIAIEHDRLFYSLKVTSRNWVIYPNDVDGKDTVLSIRVEHLATPEPRTATVHPIRP